MTRMSKEMNSNRNHFPDISLQINNFNDTSSGRFTQNHSVTLFLSCKFNKEIIFSHRNALVSLMFIISLVSRNLSKIWGTCYIFYNKILMKL